MYETKPVAVYVSGCGRKQTFLTALVISAVLAIAAPARAQSIGIAQCDDYLAKYEACISPKMSPATQSMLRGMLDNMRKTWGNIAKNASETQFLEDSCKKFMDNMKTKLETCSLP